MLFSAHVVDSSPIAALRRRTPQPGDVAGLRSARNGIAAPFTKGVLPRPQLGREVLLGAWDDESALDRFLAEDPSGQVFADGWELRMELYRAVGVFPGLDEAETQAAAAEGHEGDGPSVAFTLGTAYARTFVPFMRVNSGLEDQFLETPTGLWGTALSNIPQRFVATITVWESGDAAIDYMKSGAHGAAVDAHYDPKKDPTGHTFVTGGGFLGFRPLSSRGSVGGKNPISPSIIGL